MTIIRNGIPNAFSDHAKIVPLDSFTQVSDQSPEVARLLLRNPSADTNTDGLYDPQSGNVFLNVAKHLDSAEPVQEAIRTVVHEVAGHQGTRDLLGADPEYDRFLERVYNGMRNSGMGDQIAAAFGTNMDGLATRYGFGTENPDGTTTISPRGRLRLADELLARYAERFDPHQLDQVPGVLSRAIDFVRDGLTRNQGLNFSDYDALRTIRAAWASAEPPRSPESQNALLAKQIIKTNEPIESRSLRAPAQKQTTSEGSPWPLHQSARGYRRLAVLRAQANKFAPRASASVLSPSQLGLSTVQSASQAGRRAGSAEQLETSTRSALPETPNTSSALPGQTAQPDLTGQPLTFLQYVRMATRSKRNRRAVPPATCSLQ